MPSRLFSARGRFWTGAIAIVLGLVIVLALSWWRTAERNRLLAGGLATPPDTSNFPLDFQQRLFDCEKRVREGPDRVAALGELSQLYQANGFPDQAAQGYRALMAVEPDEARWPYLLGTILSGYGELGEALPLMRRTVEEAPEYLPARLRLAEGLLKMGRLEEASAAYDEVLKRKPDSIHALLGRARCDVATGRLEPARARLQRATAIRPDFSAAWNLLASVLAQAGEDAGATEARIHGRAGKPFREPPDPWRDRLLDECFDPYRLSIAAEAAANAADWLTAVRLYQRALELSPQDAFLHRQLGRMFTEVNDFAAARQHLTRAVTLAPDVSDNWVFLVELLKRADDGPALEQALREGLARCPQSPSLHLARAERLVGAGRYEESIPEFQEAQRLRPTEAAASVGLAGVFFHLGRIEQGIAQLRSSLEIEPDNPGALVSLAFYAIRSGDEAGAREWLQRARRQDRVSRSDLAELESKYQQQFGRSLK